nr:hypothetical protein [Tanacetum cinerariifolium]
MDDDDEIFNLVDLHVYMLCKGWKWQDLLSLALRRRVIYLVATGSTTLGKKPRLTPYQQPQRQDTMRDTSAHTRRVKKLDKKQMSRTYKLKRLYKVGLTVKVISSSDDEALHNEDTSKQERIDEIDVDKDITLEEVVKVVTTAKMIIDAVVDATQVTTAIVDIPTSVAETIVTTALTITAEYTKINVERTGEDLEQENAKKQKMDDDKESTELKQCLEIIPDDGDNVTIEATHLSSKSPTIIDYKIYKEGKKNYFKTFRVDGNSQMYLTFSKLLKNFNREDLKVLWRLVKDINVKTKPVDYMDSFLLHTLKTMFE